MCTPLKYKIPSHREFAVTAEMLAGTEYIPQDALLGSEMEVHSQYDIALRSVLIKICTHIYGVGVGRTVDLPPEPGDVVDFEVPDPTCPPQVPATWRDHLLFDAACWLDVRSAGRPLVKWLVRRLASLVNLKEVAVVTVPRRVHIVRRLSQRFACPHISKKEKDHLRFLASGAMSNDPIYDYEVNMFMAFLDQHYRELFTPMYSSVVADYLRRIAVFHASRVGGHVPVHIEDIIKYARDIDTVPGR